MSGEYSHVSIGLPATVISVTVPKTTFNYGILAIIAILIVLLMIGIFLVFNFQSRQSQLANISTNNDYNPPPLAPTVTNQVGAWPNGDYHQPSDATFYRDATTCDANTTSTWNIRSGSCDCILPYWGTKCQRETYSNKYVSSGRYLQPASLEILSQQHTNSLSYPIGGLVSLGQNIPSCTDLCDVQPDCVGVRWIPQLSGQVSSGQQSDQQPNNCTLFKNLTVDSQNQLLFNPNVDSQLFFKTANAPTIRNSVYLYSGTLPVRYWLLDSMTPMDRISGNNLLHVRAGVVYTLTFLPTAVATQTDLTGVYSTATFDATQYDQLLSRGDTATTYIHRPNTALQIPTTWSNQQIWLMYR